MRRLTRPALPALPSPLLAALIALPPALVALAGGLPATVDGALHVHRTLSVAYLLVAAPGWPRWAPHFLQGWGYPIHHFYPPGAPLVTAVLVAAGAGPAQAHVALIGAAWGVATVGTYRLARTALPASGALLAAGAAAFSPVRLFEVQVQGNVPQLVAAALVPFALAGAVGVVRAPGVRSAVGLAVPTAAIALTHHVTTVLVLPVLGLVGFASIVASHPRTPAGGRAPDGRARSMRAAARAAFSGAGGLALAALLSCVYWLPAVADAKRVQIGKAAAGMFDVSSQLVPAFDLVRPLGLVDRTAHSWPFHHGWGPVAAALATLGIAAILRPNVRTTPAGRRLAGFALVGAAVTLLTLGWSAPLWRSTAVVGLVQFPWRLLAVAEPLLATTVGAAILWLPERRRPAGLAIGLALLAASALPWLVPIRTAPAMADRTARAAVRAERQADAAIGTTSSQEYLPRGANPDLSVPPSAAALEAYADGRWWVEVDRPRLPAGLTATTEPLGRHGSEIVVGPGAAVALRLRQIGFPGWRTTVDGRTVANGRDADGDGALVVSVPAADRPRHVVARFVGTALGRGAGAVSVAGWLAVLALACASAARRRPAGRYDERPDDRGDDVRAPSRLLLAVAIVGGGALASVALPGSTFLAPRSDVAAPAAMDVPLHVALGDGKAGPAIELLGFDAAGRARAGGALEVRLYWRALRPMAQRYRPFVQLWTKGSSTVVANDTSSDPGGRPTRTWPLDRFVVDVHRLAIAPDAGLMTVRLIAGLFDDDTGQRLTTSGGDDLVDLREVRVEPSWSDALRLHLGVTPDDAVHRRADSTFGDVRFGDAIELRGAAARPTEGPGGGPAVEVTLVWRATGRIDRAATVFRHVLDAADATIAQLDGPPAAGDAPTLDWQRGDVVVDRVLIPIPPGAAPPAVVAVGLYAQDGGARLPAVGADGRLRDDIARVPVVRER